jgi:predicted GH43/DUF377 family glycosyl hydrolase
VESPGDSRARPRTAIAGLARLAVLSALAACGPASAPTLSPSVTSGSPSAAPTAAPTTTPAPAVTKRFAFGEDVVVSTAIAGTDDKYVNPGAVMEVDGVLHMFPNVFSAWPGRVRVPHLTSEDGLAWTLDKKAAPLDSQDVEVANPGIDVSSGFVAEDGTWVLVFETVAQVEPWAVWRATAPTATGPWTIGAKPIVSAGASGAFDAGGTQWPSVVRVGDRWALYYAGFDRVHGGTGSIGVAFSLDGATWEKQPEPVLVATETWEGRLIDRPRVVATPGGLVMLYAGRDLNDRGLATSQDGVTWTSIPGPNIEAADFPISGRAWDSALLYRGGQLDYFLEIGLSTTNVYRATLPWP